MFKRVRIINRVVQTKETKDSIVTHITERIVETDIGGVLPVVVSGSRGSNQSSFQVECNICTQLFDYDESGNRCCPACGSRDVSLV